MTSELALLGGEPVIDASVSWESWPPVTQRGRERILAVYESQRWSFHAEAEREFCDAFASLHDVRHAIFMMNGTVTLEAALAALGVGPGDEVIVPALTWVATAMAVHYVGATPVFADVEPSTLCLDPRAFEAAVTVRTRAVIPVHLYGSMADLDAILAIAGKHDIAVVEDCAHMQGGRWAGRGVGSWGQVGSFSFQESKTLAAGEGGICLTNDDDLAERLFRYKHIGYAPGQRQGMARTPPLEGLLCRNYRATGFQAAILLDQLETLEERLDRYEANAAIIDEVLKDADCGVRMQQRGRRAERQGYYAATFVFDGEPAEQIPSAALMPALAAEGIPVKPSYGPVYRHMLYNLPPDRYRIEGGACPAAEQAGTARAVCLAHERFGMEGRAESVAEALIKVAQNAAQLADWKSEER